MAPPSRIAGQLPLPLDLSVARMIRGQVNHRREAVVPLRLALKSGARIVDAVVDTGFNGSVAMPKAIAKEMDLSSAGRSDAYLADGTRLSFIYFRGRVTWHGHEMLVPIAMIGSEVLIGMALLDGSTLSIEVNYEGSVLIDPRT